MGFLNQGAIAYSMTSLAAAMMHAVFMVYYVNIFINHYHVPQIWFNIAQIIFMIWNAVNDPLFGYIQDNCQLSIMKTRRHTILYGAPLFALSFLVPWFPWTTEKESWITGVHLIFALCFYDAMFTYELLAICCILTEAPENVQERILYNQYSHVFSLVGSSSVFFCSTLSNNLKDFHTFQNICIIIAILSWLSLTYTGLYAKTKFDTDHHTKLLPLQSNLDKSITSSVDRKTSDSIFRLTWQILTHADFFAFVCVNFLSEFHRTSIANFTVILTKHLVPVGGISETHRSCIHGAIMFLPQLLVIIGRPVLTRIGYYKVYQVAFVLKILNGTIMALTGLHYYHMVLAFMIIDGALTMVPGNITTLALSDIVDNDMKIINRNYPLSSMVFGTNALITKPAQSFAPMLVMYIWNQHGYENLKDTISAKPSVEMDNLHNTMFTLIYLMPICVGLCQSIIWKRYRLRTTHLCVPKYTDA